jgi:phage-related protein
MSITLGDVIIWIKPDDSKLDQGLRGAEQKTRGWAGRVGGFLSNAASFAVGGFIQQGVGAITSSVGGLASEMINSNAAFEQYETRFETLLGSTDAAKERMADLAEFGAKTPFELPGVVEADIVLQGFGLHSEEAAKKFGFSGEQIRTIAGDVASGTGSDFKEMALLIGKFSAGATGEAISRMMELGITNRDELAKMGLEFSKSGQLLSPLPESMNVVLQLMQDKYGGLMDAQSSTFEGMMSNLEDWKGNMLRTLGAPIFEVLKDKLGSLLEFLSSPAVMESIDKFAQIMAQGIGIAMDWLNSTAFPALQQFGTWFISEGVPAIREFMAPILAQLIPGLIQLATWVGQIAQVLFPILAQVVKFVADNFNIFGPILAVIGGLILALTSPITLVIGAIVLLATAWANNWGGIREKTKAATDFISNIIQTAMAFIKNFWQKWGDDILAITSFLWNTIQTIAKTTLDLITFAIQAFTALIRGDWSAFGDALQGIWSTTWDAISSIFSDAKDTLVQIASDIKEKILAVWDGIKSKFEEIGDSIVQGIKDGISAAWDSLTGWFGDLVDKFIEKIKKKFGIGSPSLVFANIGRDLMAGLTLGIEQNQQSPARAMTQTTNNIVNNFYQTINTPHVGNLSGEFQQMRALLST